MADTTVPGVTNDVGEGVAPANIDITLVDEFRNRKHIVQRQINMHKDKAFQLRMMADNHDDLAGRLVAELNEGFPEQQDA